MTHGTLDVHPRARQGLAGVDGHSAQRDGRLPASMDRRARLEEGLAIVCLVAVVGVELALIRVGLDPVDEGYFVEQANRVLRGDLPYRDFDSLYTPGLLYLHAVLFSLVGETHVIVPRAVGLLARALLAGSLYFLCRPLARPVFAMLPGLYVLVGLDLVPHTWEPHPGWPSAALTVFAAWAFSRLSTLSESRRPYWLLAIGGVSGLVFAFKQNAGVFLILALFAFTAWQGIDPRTTTVTRALRATQVLVLIVVIVAVAWLIHPTWSNDIAVYFLVPLAAAGVAACWRVSVASDGRSWASWLRDVVWLGLGCVLVTVPWVIALVVALDGRLNLLKGFVGAMDHGLLWSPLIGPSGGAWASLVGIAVAALFALCVRHQMVLLCVAVAAGVVFAASGILLTAEPGEAIELAAFLAPGRAAIGLPVVLPFVCILAGAWLTVRAPPTLATWRLRWMTVASALTFLTQYPRIDDVHLAWSACLPLATGAVALSRLDRTLAERWILGSTARAILVMALVAVPVATTLPGLAERGHGFVRLSDAGHLVARLEPTTIATGVPGIDGVIVTDEQSTTLLAAVRFVRANSAPGEPIFVYPSSPIVYVAADRPNPTRYAHLYPGAASAEDIEGLIATLDQPPVRLVVVSDAELAFWGPPVGNQPLETYIARNYRGVARFGPYRVLIRT